MASYSIEIKKSAAKEIAALPRNDTERIIRKIQLLADDPRPHGCRKLSGEEKYRIRVGPYRILYQIEDEKLVIYVVKVGHRREVYRK